MLCLVECLLKGKMTAAKKRINLEENHLHSAEELVTWEHIFFQQDINLKHKANKVELGNQNCF